MIHKNGYIYKNIIDRVSESERTEHIECKTNSHDENKQKKEAISNEQTHKNGMCNGTLVLI